MFKSWSNYIQSWIQEHRFEDCNIEIQTTKCIKLKKLWINLRSFVPQFAKKKLYLGCALQRLWMKNHSKKRIYRASYLLRFEHWIKLWITFLGWDERFQTYSYERSWCSFVDLNLKIWPTLQPWFTFCKPSYDNYRYRVTDKTKWKLVWFDTFTI